MRSGIFWGRFESSRPLLSLLLALARDPLLRATARAVIATPIGHEFGRQAMKDDLAAAVEHRLNDATLDTVVRNSLLVLDTVRSLEGPEQEDQTSRRGVARSNGLRTAAGVRGGAVAVNCLFETPWVAILDAYPGTLPDLAVDAGRLGLIEFKHSGQIVDVSFPRTYSGRERGLLHEPH